MFVSREFYLASLMMMGLHKDMLIYSTTGEIIGFKSGAIKPTITHSDINVDKSSPLYGQGVEWFAKTAMKYNPVMDGILKQYGVDAITFKSSNKINMFKDGINQQVKEKYVEVKGIDRSKSNADDLLSMKWTDYISDNNNIKDIRNLNDNIVELPLDAFSLRTVSKEHDPLVGANAAVHMSHKNGIAEWIGLQQKLETFEKDLHNAYADPLMRTAMAQKIFGTQAESGDPRALNSAISALLTRNSILLEPWALRRLEDNMISYYLNGGNISGGVVKSGSLDVMTADMGNLDITVRSQIGGFSTVAADGTIIRGDGRPTVQFFGEFLPSYYAGQKEFIKRGRADEPAHSVIIQRVKYRAEDGSNRWAEGYLVEIGGEKLFQIEGREITKDGTLRDIDTGREIFDTAQFKGENKALFDKVVASEQSIYEKILYGATMSDVALQLDTNPNAWVGTINSRQPRNQMGDMIMNKIGVIDAVDSRGNTIRMASGHEREGNVSRMNHLDAISPQDADFDFDKSFNYTSAPSQFVREVNKIGGYITGETPDAVINRMFDPVNSDYRFSKILPDLLGANSSYEQRLHEANLARGRFIKMHQTATYLANILRSNPEVATFDVKGTADRAGGVTTYTIKLNSQAKYVETVQNISKMAKEFIDLYGEGKLPSTESVKDIRNTQNKIWFGENGIFEVVAVDSKGRETIMNGINLDAPKYKYVMDSINSRLIDPLNAYLKYNRGIQTDPTGLERSARLENYNEAYSNLLKMIDSRNKDKISDGVNMDAGLNAAWDYFQNSRNTYDIAMQALHKIHNQRSNYSEEVGSKGVSLEKRIIE